MRCGKSSRNLRIHIQNLGGREAPKYNGKGKFIRRLARAFRLLGHAVIQDSASCDISLRMNAISTSRHGKLITRLDNCCYSNTNIHVMSRSGGGDRNVSEAIRLADGIVYQSSVGKNICEGVLGQRNSHSAVICNGVDVTDFNPSRIKLLGRKNYLIACQLLHDGRRIGKFLGCWNDFVKDKNDAYLYLVFEKSMTKIPRGIKNLILSEPLSQRKLNDIMFSVDAMILNLYQDCCPNIASECLACKTPLIVNNTNGILEFIGEEHGLVVNIDGENCFRRCRWKHPPFINGKELVSALNQVYLGDKKKFDFPPMLDILGVAKKYVSFFYEVLND